MKTIHLIFIVLLLACSNQSEKKTASLEKEIENNQIEMAQLRKEISTLNEENTSFPVNKEKPLQDIKNSISVKDHKIQVDTLDLKKYGNEYVYARTVEIAEMGNTNLATTLGQISEMLTAPGISVFSICDGDSLPLEFCNCTQNIYLSFEPENLGEEYKLYKISSYYDVKLLEIKRIKKRNDYEIKDYYLKFEHGKYPRKTETVSLFELKFIKSE